MGDTEAGGQLVAQLYPRIYHVTDFGNADGIMRHGLRSTHELLALFESSDAECAEALKGTRQRSIPLSHPEQGRASVRDQLPLSLTRLSKALIDMTVEEWLHRLNSLVFLWPTRDRVERLLTAPVYAERDHHVLTVDTAELVARHGPRMLLAPMNTGATRPFAHPRGRETFLPLGEYPLIDRRSTGAVAEIEVQDAMPDVGEYVITIERWHGSQRAEMLWERGTG
jgi:hypothetical protein